MITFSHIRVVMKNGTEMVVPVCSHYSNFDRDTQKTSHLDRDLNQQIKIAESVARNHLGGAVASSEVLSPEGEGK